MKKRIDKNLKLNRLFILGILIIISFVYTMNIQPIVFGSDINYLQIIKKNIDKKYDIKIKNIFFNSSNMSNSCFIFQKEYVYKISFEKDFKFTHKLTSIDYNETNRYEHCSLYNESYYKDKSFFLNNLVHTILYKLIKIKNLE